MKNDRRNGQGTFYYIDGSKYQGNWNDNKMNGYGTLYYPTGKVAY
jgi:antitoxin component YwqK of YwqJK toxin-antitoxin module